VRILKSALFWRILLSSLFVVAVLGWGLQRANAAHEELDAQFVRLVQHDLKLADDAEQLLRVMVDLETGKRGFLLTGDRSFLAPYEQGRRELEGLIVEAQEVAENGMEDERVAAFGRLMRDWIQDISEPQIQGRQQGKYMDPAAADEGKARTDEMRAILADLRQHALAEADGRQRAAFESANDSQRTTRTVILFAIILALGTGAWIASDIAGTTAQLEEALLATGRLQPIARLTARRDELGAVGDSLQKMNTLLLDKDASLRATLADRERAVADLTRANAALALRDERASEYAAFVRELKTLDVAALAGVGLERLVRLADAQVGIVYLLDDADQLVPIRATAVDGRTLDHHAFAAEGLPRSVMEKREPVFIRLDGEGATAPEIDLGVAKATVRWALAYPIALGQERAGAIVLAGMRVAADDGVEFVREATRQLSVALHNAWAHDRLRDKSIALTEQGERLTRANRVKTEFLASMSHELRTPLSAILGFADLLLTSPKEQLSPRARESIERIKRNGHHLLELINDVLDLAKAETGRVELRLAPVNLGPMVHACVAEVDSLREGKDIVLSVDVGGGAVEVVTDAQRVRQILLNLLANAIKFTDRGEVTVTLRSTPSEVQLAVRDTGIGIPAGALKELFQDFHQLEAGDGRRYDGTGVGLALSRRLARALGGEVDVRSTEGVGSTFTLVLPRVSPHEGVVAAASLTSPTGTEGGE
jgi:signal transduction histidine kinase/CHASE3 domain sensor protein